MATKEYLRPKAAESLWAKLQQTINKQSTGQVNLYQQPVRSWAPCSSQHSSGKTHAPRGPQCCWDFKGKQSCSPGSQGAVLLCAFTHMHTPPPPHPSLKAENPARIQTKPFCCFECAKSVPFSQLQDCVSQTH